jgi:ribosomal-protein-alanine N-acetyltransferase
MADLPAVLKIQRDSGEAAQWSPSEFLVAESESQITGFLVTREVAGGEYEVLNIAVMPEFRRRGVAWQLMKHAMGEAPGTYFLEVRESNHAAQQLYRKLGFEQAGVRRKYYSDPEESAIVMRFRS